MDEHDQAQTVYTCPMHPDVQAAQPGQCPKCGMSLVPTKSTLAKEYKPHEEHEMKPLHDKATSMKEHAEQPVQSPLSRSERKKLRRMEKQRRREQAATNAKSKRILQRGIGWSLAAAILAGAAWLVLQGFSAPNEDLIARRGIHWHADLAITIKGQPVDIPSDIGLGVKYQDMHTHKVNDQIHIEMQRAVYPKDVRLGNFFRIWGKQFSSQCILESCNGPEGKVKMLVNGQENTEYENYHMRDKDRIEITYE